MLKRIGLLTAVGVLCVSWAGAAQAQCIVDTSTPTYANGEFLRYHPCDANGNVKVTGGGGGGGAATIADGADVALGATTDAATTAGGAGTVSAKLRNATALLDALNTAISTLNAKLPSAGALADGTSNPTTTGVAAYNMCFNGTTWDRCNGTSTLHYATSAASTNATNVKASAGTVSTISVVNTTAATAAVSILDGATSIQVFPNSPCGGIGTYTIPLDLVPVADDRQSKCGQLFSGGERR